MAVEGNINPAILAAREKLKERFADVRTGGKGTTRRKKRVVHSGNVNEDKKLQTYMKRLNLQAVPGIEEINLFHNNGNVTHFANPKMQASIAANTFVVSGRNETKSLKDMLPKIVSQLGPENIADLKKIIELGGVIPTGTSADDDDVPDLVGDNFEEVSKSK